MTTKIILHNGGYLKTSGDPLQPGQQVMLANGTFTLPQSFKEGEHKGRIIRSWGVPDGNGKYYGLAEILTPEQVAA